MSKFRRYFVKAVISNYPKTGEVIITKTDKQYKSIALDTSFVRDSKNPLDKRLDFCSYFLAFIKTLDEHGEDFETIRTICLEITEDYIRPKNIVQAFIKRQLPKLTNTWLSAQLFKVLNRKISNNENPQGFIAKIITDKKETYGFGYGIDILECGICKLFKKHNYQNYTSILCEVDKLTSELSGLQLLRTGTIAKGAKKCDFRFKRLNTTKTE